MNMVDTFWSHGATLFLKNIIDNRKCYRNIHGRGYEFYHSGICNWTHTMSPRNIHRQIYSFRNNNNPPCCFYIDSLLGTLFGDWTSSDIGNMWKRRSWPHIHHLICKIHYCIGNLQIRHNSPNHLFGTSWTDIVNQHCSYL